METDLCVSDQSSGGPEAAAVPQTWREQTTLPEQLHARCQVFRRARAPNAGAAGACRLHLAFSEGWESWRPRRSQTFNLI